MQWIRAGRWEEVFCVLVIAFLKKADGSQHIETLYSFTVIGENFGILEKLHVGSAFEDYIPHEI